MLVFVCLYACVYVRIETGLSQSMHLGEMDHFFSRSHGSPGQMIGNQIIQFIFLKMAIMDAEQNLEHLLPLDCCSSEHNSVLLVLEIIGIETGGGYI